MDLQALLDQAQRADLLRLATAGSVDDGKSTLIGRLLADAQGLYDDQLAAVRAASTRSGQVDIDWALVTDGLKAEREQRITIDVAYRHFSTPRRRFIIADTPGHEQYTRNMVTGASTADLAVVLIDAAAGVLTQSKRHGFIASLLGIPHLVVAVNKMDLVEWSQEVFEAIRAEYLDWSTRLRWPNIVFIPVSALLGDNVTSPSSNMPWYRGPALLEHLETVPLSGSGNLIDFRFPVQYVLRPSAEFRGYSGSVASGTIRVGEEVLALPSGRRATVTRLIGASGEQQEAFWPQAVTACLDTDLDIARGDMLVRPGNVPWVTNHIEAIGVWLSEQSLDSKRAYLLKHTTRLVRATVDEVVYHIDPNTLHRDQRHALGLNDIARLRLSTRTPILCDEYAKNRSTGSFILIDPETDATVAAGMIIDRAHRQVAPVTHLTAPSGVLTAADRARQFGQQPAVIWLTGLSGSGKSTIARALEVALFGLGQACFVLDGDSLRGGLNRDLGFGPADRAENIRRLAEVAKLFCEAGLLVITAFISPYRADRDRARELLGSDRYIEIHVSTDLAVCEQRDVKGLYARARAGEIEEFTGLSAPYEAPTSPDLRIDTAVVTVEAAVANVLALLRERGLIGVPSGE